MRYILDFDRVLFDTDSFNAKLVDSGLSHIPRSKKLIEAIDEKGIDWKIFVCAGVVDFLTEFGNRSIIVSSCTSKYRNDNEAPEDDRIFFQKEKISQSGLADLVTDVIVVPDTKADALQDLYTEGDVFVDDVLEHAETAKKCGYKTVWLKKAYETETSELDTIASFADFVALVQLWRK